MLALLLLLLLLLLLSMGQELGPWRDPDSICSRRHARAVLFPSSNPSETPKPIPFLVIIIIVIVIK